MSSVDPRGDDLPGQTTIGEAGGVRALWVQSPNMQGLVDRLALVLEEHMTDGDELHVTYNSMQAGWTDHPHEAGGLRRSPRPASTELHFEYSAFVVLRARQPPAALTRGD
jgi:hypothetical protein